MMRKKKEVKLPPITKSCKVNDHELLEKVNQAIQERPTYGYRRITALLNRGKDKKINHKRIYRVMSENGLLLTKHGKKPSRTHEGKVITMKSDMRWCSDGFCIQCDNGDQVHVAFAIDACDREALGFIASTVGINSDMICDLLFEAVEYRFKQGGLPKKLQWLTDNGPYYTSKKTVAFARELGFEVCTTPAYSPQSNGMAEAFVKTFKRDYVSMADISSAETVMRQLARWFDEYNEIAPHKGLKMCSPRQFRRMQLGG
jgi:putative transposase